MAETSDIAFIDPKTDDPFDLFKRWYAEARKYSTGMTGALCLATVSKDMRVSARHLMLRRLDDDGFVVYTDKRSRKAKELEETGSAAMCFLWTYANEEQQQISRQVRVEGEMIVLDRDDYVDLFEEDKLFCKIRAYICHQDQEVDWNELKAQHDQLLKEVKENKKSLPMPDYYIGYKMIPKSIEFYHASDNLIADRILFQRDSPTCEWSHKRLAA